MLTDVCQPILKVTQKGKTHRITAHGAVKLNFRILLKCCPWELPELSIATLRLARRLITRSAKVRQQFERRYHTTEDSK